MSDKLQFVDASLGGVLGVNDKLKFVEHKRMNLKELPYFHRVKWDPDRSELRRFAIAMLVGFSVLGLLSAWRHGSISTPAMVLFGVGIFLAVTALIPGLGRVVYLAVMLPTSFIGYFVSKVVLFLVFFLVFVPIGALLRLLGKDLLRLRPQSPRAIWWPTDSVKDSSRYYRQF